MDEVQGIAYGAQKQEDAMQGRFPVEVDFSDGYARLNYNNAREDIAYGMDKSLDQLEIYNSSNQLIKKFDFTYSYFVLARAAVAISTSASNLRRFTEKTLTQAHPPYTFTYNEAVQALSRSNQNVEMGKDYPNGSLHF